MKKTVTFCDRCEAEIPRKAEIPPTKRVVIDNDAKDLCVSCRDSLKRWLGGKPLRGEKR